MTVSDADRGFDPRWRPGARAVAAVLVGIMVYGALVLSQADREAAALRRERQALEKSVRDLQITVAKWKEFTGEEAALKEHLLTLDAMMPAQPAEDELGASLRAFAGRHGVDIQLLRHIRQVTIKGSYQVVPIEIHASGPFAGLVAFADGLARGRRVLKLTRLDVYPAAAGHRARFELETYVFVGDQGKKR